MAKQLPWLERLVSLCISCQIARVGDLRHCQLHRPIDSSARKERTTAIGCLLLLVRRNECFLVWSWADVSHTHGCHNVNLSVHHCLHQPLEPAHQANTSDPNQEHR
uniref:Uncharacterized protein n=1 Tax=Arundo donax TaxID=35708 RepID=A0A0A9GD96_ARUDO